MSCQLRARKKITIRSSVAFRRAKVSILPLLVFTCGSLSAGASGVYSFESEKDREVRQLRTQEIHQIQLTLARRQPVNRQADLYFRLAEIYLELYRATFLLEGEAHEARVKNQNYQGKLNRQESRRYLYQGLNAANAIVNLKIPYERMDQVTYFLAYYHRELDQTALSQKYYQEFINRYPRSPLAFEAHQELGDAAYQKPNYAEAIRHYRKAIEHHKSEQSVNSAAKFVVSVARTYLRLAWCYYRTKQVESAVSAMQAAVRLTRSKEGALLALREEAVRSLALFMTEARSVQDTLAYFTQELGDEQEYPKMLEDLAEEYLRSAQLAQTIKIFEALKTLGRDPEVTMRIFVKIIEAELSKLQYASAIRRIQTEPLLRELGSAHPERLAQVLALVRKVATTQHEVYRKKKDDEALDLAEKFYSVYLDPLLKVANPPNAAEQRIEIQVYLAELKHEQGKFLDAAKLYGAVVASGESRYRRQAAVLRVGSLEAYLQKIKERTPNAKAPSEAENAFVKATAELAEIAPEAPETRKAVLRAAQILGGYRTTIDEAQGLARRVVDQWPQTAEAVTAARLIVQILGDQIPNARTGDPKIYAERTSALREVIAQMLSNTKLMAADAQFAGSGKNAGKNLGKNLVILPLPEHNNTKPARFAEMLKSAPPASGNEMSDIADRVRQYISR